MTFDSSITRSIGGVADFDALPAVDRAPLMAWMEDLSSENESRHLSQLIVELYMADSTLLPTEWRGVCRWLLLLDPVPLLMTLQAV